MMDDLKKQGLNMTNYRPVQENIYRQIKANIDNAVWVEKLPAISELCQDYQINPKTLRKVTDRLVEEKVVEVKHGLGTYLRKQPPNSNQSTERILLVVPYYRGHFVSEIVQKFVEFQQTKNIDVVVFGYNECIEQSLPKILPQWDRVVLFHCHNLSPGLRRHLSEFSSRARLLTLNYRPRGLKSILVTGDNSFSGEMAVSSMLKLGYKKIAFFRTIEHASTKPCQRLKGYLKAIENSGLKYRKVVNYHPEQEWLERKFSNMIAKKEMPEVIIMNYLWAPLIHIALFNAAPAYARKTKFLIFDPSHLEKSTGCYAIVQPINKIVKKSIELLIAKDWKCHNINIPLEFINYSKKTRR